ncbi:MAG: uracil-DNA glycosylase [Planctomycetes bacterium]|nr:uracil-DNA glycosylase [Planctomycetota bacterium]MBL7040144.1 uracil-DNA glycosylase [Pirellulaceae bacterium]
MNLKLPPSWRRVLGDELSESYYRELQAFVRAERRRHTVYPPVKDVFAAFDLTPFKQVRVLLLGQDPYHDEGQSHGLCFSVRHGVKPPPSLANIFKELHDDVGCDIPNHGCLESWAQQGVLMLNTVLTVRAHQAHSHRGRGWEIFTDAVIRKVNEKSDPVVFVLWGRPAQKKSRLIDLNRHALVQAAHPSPLSARRGFFGSKPFSAINRELGQLGHKVIDWRLPNHTELSNER